jgi:hypothetical protein
VETPIPTTTTPRANLDRQSRNEGSTTIAASRNEGSTTIAAVSPTSRTLAPDTEVIMNIFPRAFETT